MARRGGKSSMVDEDFYSSLAADLSDGSEGSETDHKKLARSLGGLDDMDEDILGSLSTKKKSSASKQSVASTLPAKSSLTSSKAAAGGKAKTTFNIDDIMAEDGNDFDSILASRPKTTDDSRKSSKDIFADTKPRPATTEQPRKAAKQIDHDDLDMDDLLAELGDLDEPMKKKSAPAKKSNTEESQKAHSPEAIIEPGGVLSSTAINEPEGAPSEPLPAARPATRSGNRPADDIAAQFPVKTRGAQGKAADEGSDWDESSGSSTAPAHDKVKAAPDPITKPAAKKKDTVTFSDDEDDLDLGLDDSPVGKAKERKSEKSVGGMADSLFGKSSSVEKHLQRPGTGESQREFNLSDSKGSAVLSSSGNIKSDGKQRKSSDDDDDIFGSYAPSAISSRPGTGRSVRFEDEEPLQRRPATADAALSAANDDWLGLGSDKQQKKRPLGLSSTVDFSSGGLDDDWLDMASSRPKTAPPVAGLDKKPPRTPEKKPVINVSKGGGGDDWLSDLTAKVDDDAEASLKNMSRRLSADKLFSRQSSLESGGSASRRPPLVKQGSGDSAGSTGRKPLVKQSSADDWLGLGEEKPAISLSTSKPPTSKPPVVEDTDWLGLGASASNKEDDTEQWIKSAKLRRQKSSDSILGDASKASGTFSLSNQQEKPSTLPWEEPTTIPSSANQPTGSIFDSRQAAVSKPAVSAAPKAVSSQHVFQPMFVSAQPAAPPAAILADPGSWNQEQESPVLQNRVQMEQMQQQFNQMMDARRQQQQTALERQKKMAEEAFTLQQQQLQAAISGVSPSPVFPSGLSPTKQSEMQLDNTALEGKVRRLEHEKSHLESLVDSMKKRHQEELTAIDTSNKSRILMVEESYQRREFRLREEIEQLSSENLIKIRHAEEEKTTMLAAQYRKIDELEKSKSMEIERMRRLHREEVERMKEDHHLTIEILRKSKEQELEGLLSTSRNPQSLQFLMEQMKQSTAGLTALQFDIGKSHQGTLDERELAMNSRDHQLKVLQECLQRQQEENDKERSRLQELIAKMEIQLREQERQLHQEKWIVSQEKSKLHALQTAVDQERTLLNDQLSRERTGLNRSKDSFLAEQQNAMVQLADERRLIAEERSQLTISQRMAAEKGQEAVMKESRGSAKYEGLIRSMENERKEIAERSRTLAVEEAKMSVEQSSFEKEKEFVEKEKERLNELAQKIQKEMNSIETFSKDCVEKDKEGRQALMESRRLDSSNQARLSEISSRLEELKTAEKRFAEERLQLARERKQMDSLKSMQLCAGCKQPVSRNPYFSLGNPILRTRMSPSSVGVVAPQRLDITDPSILQYKIQADQDSDFLNEESMYLDALKYSPYHNKSMP